MDLNPKGRLRISVLLVILSRVLCTKDLSPNLHCVNDYVSAINCTLQSNLSADLGPWLKLEKNRRKKKDLLCHLSWNNDRFYCSVKCDAFLDRDDYKISLCYQQESTSCKVLDEKYRPVYNIKPKHPCCLTWKHNSSQYHFYWKSTYEEDIGFIALPEKLAYQLHIYESRQQFNGKPHDVNTAKTTFTVQDDYFKPDSEYFAEVRSKPSQSYSKNGQWSDWSPKTHWRTPPKAGDTVFDRKKLLILVCVLVPVILSLCFIYVKKWKQVYIPTPEPYFHTLYTDCHGDFKSWVIMDNTGDLPITEKTNHIEKIVEREDIHYEVPSRLPQGSGYANMSGSEYAFSESGPPYAGSTPGLDSARVSCTSACLSSQSRSPAEGDSGCWLSSDRSLEQNHLWYCNDYCTLSAFQQSALCTQSGSLKCSTCMIMRHDAIEETECL